jgi:adenine-specific DNA-methyltransferase
MTNEGFIIYKDSTATSILSGAVHDRNTKTIDKLIKNGYIEKQENDLLKFVKEYVFNSPSAASDIVLGNSTSGWKKWKPILVKHLKNYMNLMKNNIITTNNSNLFNLQSRRYIGNKYKLSEWIFSIIDKECKGDIFADIFAGTGVVSAQANGRYKKIILNDFLYSNYSIYQAFFGKSKTNIELLNKYIHKYNNLDPKNIQDNYFSKSFGNKYFTNDSAKIIGYIRDHIEKNKNQLSDREYFILNTSLLYATDSIANTVGHYDAYFKNKDYVKKLFSMKMINPVKTNSVDIYREDANLLVKKIKADIVYIDPPYNSRQYSRFYHVLENLIKWEKPKLFGTALKPAPENMSDYCRVSAKDRFAELIKDIKAKYIVVSYNNTYKSKSNSSENKITHEEILEILNSKGKTKVFEKDYRHFNSGKTNFDNHKEFLFVTYVKDN